MNDKVTIKYAGEIPVLPGKSPLELYEHQEEAIKKLSTKKLDSHSLPFSGLIVIPTGGGKTRLAVRWLLSNVINRHKKVLWIAHRHQLLEQAYIAVRDDAYENVLPKRTGFRFHIISGQHGKPVNIRREDDFIIASKDSLNKGMDHLLNNWLNYADEVFLFIDEAHHAPAKSYRRIIEAVKEKSKVFRMLGVTATPFRTAQNEQGLLGELFKDDMIYGIDLQTLIDRDILAKPVFEELKTHLDLTRELTNADIKEIYAFDKLPEHIARQIAESSERNKRIVTHYLQKQSENGQLEYGQLLVFAINQIHAIHLNKLFNDELNKFFKTTGRTYSEYVIADVKDLNTGVNVASEENRQKIERFRNGEFPVLVNVNILTEGADLPKVQTVFLTRPTMSTILMTQMIGRALRGRKANGTEKAYIVSFIDDWKDKISWVNPERVCIETPGAFPDNDSSSAKQIGRLIAISKIEEFARMMNERVPELEALEFLQRIPVGIYSFSILIPLENGNSLEKNCEVLVFDHIQQAYRDFVNGLELLFKEAGLAEVEDLADEELDFLWEFVIAEYFAGYDNVLPGYRDQDVKDILRYYAQKDVLPTFLKFEDREKCDLAKEARYIFEHLRVKDKPEYIESLWNDENGFWRVLFGYRKDYFIRQLSIEEEKLWGPKPEESKEIQIKFDEVDIARLPLSEIIKTHREYWRKLHDGVFAKHTNLAGLVTCAGCGLQSKHKIHFQIDHIVPLSKGGLSEISNLQILCRKCNAVKGDQIIHFQSHNTPPAAPPVDFPNFKPPANLRSRDEWENFLHRTINDFYGCVAVESIRINFLEWYIDLHPGNNPLWLEPHRANLITEINYVRREAGLQEIKDLSINSSDRPEVISRPAVTESLIEKSDTEPKLEVEARCMKCKTSRHMDDPKRVQLPNGRFAWQGPCSVCGTKMSRITLM